MNPRTPPSRHSVRNSTHNIEYLQGDGEGIFNIEHGGRGTIPAPGPAPDEGSCETFVTRISLIFQRQKTASIHYVKITLITT